MFTWSNTVKNSGKKKYVFSGYGIAYYGVGSQSFGKDFPRNVVIFGLHNSLSSQADNFRNNFQCQIKDILLVLIEPLVHQIKCLV